MSATSPEKQPQETVVEAVRLSDIRSDTSTSPRNLVAKIAWLLFSLNGRINYKGFWLSACFILPVLFWNDVLAAKLQSGAYTLVELACAILVICFALWTNIALVVKRLHDFGLSGWFFIPFIAAFVAVRLCFPSTMVPGFVFVFIFGTSPGSKKENKHGAYHTGIFPSH